MLSCFVRCNCYAKRGFYPGLGYPNESRPTAEGLLTSTYFMRLKVQTLKIGEPTENVF